ncbi:MAG: twin-arginine translocase TatA/TatE family subunit [Rubrobacteraceae bacterium]
MFGVGMQELLLIGVFCLLIFGPGKMTNMAREAGHFVSQARNSIEDLKSEMELDDDFEDEDEAEWPDQEEPENPQVTPEEHRGNHDQRSPVPEQDFNEEFEDVSSEE